MHIPTVYGYTYLNSHQAQLPFLHLPLGAIDVHIFLDLQGQALLSISTFCDAGWTAVISATEVCIEFNGKTVLTGARVPPGLWVTKLKSKLLPSTEANSA
jgi:hypothetical protein